MRIENAYENRITTGFARLFHLQPSSLIRLRLGRMKTDDVGPDVHGPAVSIAQDDISL